MTMLYGCPSYPLQVPYMNMFDQQNLTNAPCLGKRTGLLASMGKVELLSHPLHRSICLKTKLVLDHSTTSSNSLVVVH